MIFPTGAAELSAQPSTRGDFCRLKKQGRALSGRLNLGLALRTYPHQNRRSRLPHEDPKLMTSVLESETASQRISASLRRRRSGGKEDASSVKSSSVMERLQAERQKLKHGRSASLVILGRPA